MKNEMPRGSFGGDKWVDYFDIWDSLDWRANWTAGATPSRTSIADLPGHDAACSSIEPAAIRRTAPTSL